MTNKKNYILSILTIFLFIKRKGILFCLFPFLSLFLSSCNNDHCDEPMYAPMVISFYSEADTSKQIAPRFLTLQGINSNGDYIDSIFNVLGNNNIELPLNDFEESCNFLFTLGDESETDTFKFIGKKIKEECPCEEIQDSFAVYVQKKDTFFLCNKNEKYNIWTFENKNRNTKEILYKGENSADSTIFAYKLTEDILNIKYSNNIDFVSAECGCLVTHILDTLEFKNGKIGEIKILNKAVTSKYNEKHIRIYLENY